MPTLALPYIHFGKIPEADGSYSSIAPLNYTCQGGGEPNSSLQTLVGESRHIAMESSFIGKECRQKGGALLIFFNPAQDPKLSRVIMMRGNLAVGLNHGNMRLFSHDQKVFVDPDDFKKYPASLIRAAGNLKAMPDAEIWRLTKKERHQLPPLKVEVAPVNPKAALAADFSPQVRRMLDALLPRGASGEMPAKAQVVFGGTADFKNEDQFLNVVGDVLELLSAHNYGRWSELRITSGLNKEVAFGDLTIGYNAWAPQDRPQLIPEKAELLQRLAWAGAAHPPQTVAAAGAESAPATAHPKREQPAQRQAPQPPPSAARAAPAAANTEMRGAFKAGGTGILGQTLINAAITSARLLNRGAKRAAGMLLIDPATNRRPDFTGMSWREIHRKFTR